MGYYLNNEESYTMYQEVINSPYFVDKTAILDEILPLITSSEKCICITRPRRFGKTVMAHMIASFLSKARSSEDLFCTLDIAQSCRYRKYLNNYNIIYIDFSEMDDECKNYEAYIKNIKELLREDLHAAYPNVGFRKNGTIPEDLKRIYSQTHENFVFVLDEWDAIFHVPFITERDKAAYLLFLKNLLKGKAYVAFAYMTGILPIAKYSSGIALMREQVNDSLRESLTNSGSELNMFLEYTMATEEKYSDYFGFTESEVDELYNKYLSICSTPRITRSGLKTWYDGYHTRSGERVYNPRSVVASLLNNNLGNYWTSSGPYDEIFYYIERNVDAVRDDLALMISGTEVEANIREYSATSMNLSTRDEIFSAMVVYGFLSSENGYIFIPNKELMERFADMLQKEPSLGYIYRLAKESDRMLKATLSRDTETMTKILEFAHNTECPLLNYNNETDLTAVINLVYLSARDSYRIEREDKAGTGYVDFIFYPEKDKSADAIILELKIDHTPEDAIQQIKDRQYALRFKGKLGEISEYTGKILAVGIAYDKKTKKHCCKIEELIDPCND